jgi:hypothetical protein
MFNQKWFEKRKEFIKNQTKKWKMKNVSIEKEKIRSLYYDSYEKWFFFQFYLNDANF